MTKGLSSYEGQAKLSVIFGLVAGVAALALVFFVMQRFNFESMRVEYGAGSSRKFLIVGAAFISLAVAFMGAMAGYNSAGQRRNSTPKLSWMGFFLNSAVLLVALCMFVFWYLARDELQLGA